MLFSGSFGVILRFVQEAFEWYLFLRSFMLEVYRWTVSPGHGRVQILSSR